MTTEETCVCTFHVNPWKERVLQREGSQLFAFGAQRNKEPQAPLYVTQAPMS